MSAERLGRFAAGLFVALGLAFGGSLLAVAGDDAVAPTAAHPATVTAAAAQTDLEWS